MAEEILVTIIGAGVIGCAIACELSKGVSGDIVVVEKNPSVKGENQSSRNSGVIHAGIYYPRDFGPLKSRLCVEGNSLIYEFCREYNVPCWKCGKLVVATDTLEEEYLEDVLRIGNENGVQGITVLDKAQVKKFEPNINVKSALHIPSSGIVEATSLVDAFYRKAEDCGVIFLTGNKVTGISPSGEKGFDIKVVSSSYKEEFHTRILINSAGLYSDEIARMVNPGSGYVMEPVKGESAKFFSFKRPELHLNGMNIYPVPFGYLPDGERLNVPFKEFCRLFRQHKVTKSVGVHISPTFEADFATGRQRDIMDLSINASDTNKILNYGAGRMTGYKYKAGSIFTIGPAYSKPESREDYKPSRDESYYLTKVLPFFPGLKKEDISLNQVGIRAKLKDHFDFVIERDRNFPMCINLIGIDSPGLTSSPAIASYIRKMVMEMI